MPPTKVVKTQTTQQPLKYNQRSLLILSFFEGAAVMIAELCGAKMLAPYFGTSLYVWASTLAITLGALTIGYYSGGMLCQKAPEKKAENLFHILCLSALLVVAMPWLSKGIMNLLIGSSLITGSIIAQLIFLAPAVLLMGMVSPIIIGLISEQQDGGKSAGMVYAISTLGGVLATITAGFWLLPSIGITALCAGAGLTLLAATLIILKQRRARAIVPVLLCLIFIANYLWASQPNLSAKYTTLHHSEGMLGQIKIMQFSLPINNKPTTTRVVLVNHNWQTWEDSAHHSLLYYPKFVDALCAAQHNLKKTLIIGLGGGTLARIMNNRNIAYDAVEIDPRLPQLSEEYFGVANAIENTIIDDGRHYLNTCTKKYDLIIIDALLGENIPAHLLSIEAFETIKTLLNDDGILFTEFDGIAANMNGDVQKMLFNSLQKAGFYPKVYGSQPNEIKYDCMFIAKKENDFSFENSLLKKDAYFAYDLPLKAFEITQLISSNTADYITDDKPNVDFLLRHRMVAFREEMVAQYNEEFLDDGVLFFK